MPISWKDNYDTAGTVTEAGSALLQGRVPVADARVLANATAAGLVCLGKTHLSELAFSGLGLNPITATPPNVNAPNGAPGGSSSGAAASVAHGLAAAGIGSDTAGSVRIPAVWNDLIGLKTSHGLLSLDGVVPLCATLDTVGPLCRSVEDAALLCAAMAGRPAPDLAGATLKGTRLMLLRTTAMDDLQDAPRAAFTSARERLQAAGAEVTARDIPLIGDVLALAPVLFATEAYATWKTAIEAAPGKMYDQILDRFRSGAGISGTDYLQARQKLLALRRAWAAEVAPYDAVILPTAPNMPPDVTRLQQDRDYYVAQNLLTLRNTRIGSLLDLPGVTLPTGVPSTGLLMMTPTGTDARLLRLARAAEAALA